MYHPAGARRRIHRGPEHLHTASFDLSGWRLDGVGFTFPPGTVLGPGAYAVVASNRDGFAAAYGFGVLPVGEFPGTLQNDGERLRLIKPGATPEQDLLVDEVRYDSEPPWPTQARRAWAFAPIDGPAQDNWRVGNWAAAPSRRRRARHTRARPTPLADNAPALSAGLPQRSPAREPDRPGRPRRRPRSLDRTAQPGHHRPRSVRLLPDQRPTPTSRDWAFPAGTSIGPGEFLVVWADGEPAESTAGELHTSFRLAPTNGAIALVRAAARRARRH